MYCASCGAAMTPGLSYCNRCGANKLSQVPIEATPDVAKQTEYLIMLVWAIVTVAVVGVGAPIGLMALMKEVLHLENGLILVGALLSFLPFLAAEIVFIWLVLRSRSGSAGFARAKGATTRELEEAQPRALTEPASSITEHTTHTLDPVSRRGNAE
jgi:uncharacterized paraquat-inducible protein A